MVADASDPYVNDHMKVVSETLDEVGADSQSRILVLNKTDTVAGQDALAGLLQTHPEAIVVSAKDGTGLNQLKSFLLNSFTEVPKVISVS